MSDRNRYRPGPATGATVTKDGERSGLLLVRELRHPPEAVWEALTDPAQISEWAPFEADRNLGDGGTVKLSTLGTPTPQVAETTIKRAEAPKVLEYEWGGNDIRWELEAVGTGTRLSLWHHMDRRFIAWGAAGWHICLDVMDRFLGGHPIGRIVAGDAMNYDWERLNVEYSRAFGVDHMPFPSGPPKQ